MLGYRCRKYWAELPDWAESAWMSDVLAGRLSLNVSKEALTG
jgi:hypothetical protein